VILVGEMLVVVVVVVVSCSREHNWVTWVILPF
jgi:hypothetical protein